MNVTRLDGHSIKEEYSFPVAIVLCGTIQWPPPPKKKKTRGRFIDAQSEECVDESRKKKMSMSGVEIGQNQ